MSVRIMAGIHQHLDLGGYHQFSAVRRKSLYKVVAMFVRCPWLTLKLHLRSTRQRNRGFPQDLHT